MSDERNRPNERRGGYKGTKDGSQMKPPPRTPSGAAKAKDKTQRSQKESK